MNKWKNISPDNFFYVLLDVLRKPPGQILEDNAVSNENLIYWMGFMQRSGSKYIEFGSRSRILAQFGSGSGSGSRVMLSILKEKIKN